MSKVYATPGVYIEEKSAFPNSAVPVATAVPAFIGYTEKAILSKKDITNVPTRISSFGEYRLYFGDGPKTTYSLEKHEDPNKIYKLDPKDRRFFLYRCIKMFFANGGSDCYIVSVGNYNSQINIDHFDFEDVDKDTGEKKLSGIKTLLKEPEPTMVVIPDAVLLEEDACNDLQQRTLIHCGMDMRSRIAILDIFNGDQKRTPDASKDVVTRFRENIGSNHLQWGAVYYPWVHTTITGADALDFTNIDSGSNRVLTDILKTEIEEAKKAGILEGKRARAILEQIAKIDLFNPHATDVDVDTATAAISTAEQALTDAKNAESGFVLAVTPAEITTKEGELTTAKEEVVAADAAVKAAPAAEKAAKTAILTEKQANQATKEAELKDLKASPERRKELLEEKKAAASMAQIALDIAKAVSLKAAAKKAADDLKELEKTAASAKAAAAEAAKKAAAAPADTALATAAQTTKGTADNAEAAVKTAIPLAEAAAKAAVIDTDKIKTHHQTLTAVSPLYKAVMGSLREHINLLPPAAGMAGVYSMVDNTVGVFQSPANVSFGSVVRPAVNLTNDEQEDLNMPLNGKAVNAIRSFPGKGVLIWGARTLDGNSQDWRYVSVRRTVIFIEQSIKYAAEPYVFSPNTAATWTNVKAMLINFLTNVWQQGALAGATPEDAFSVDIGLGATMTPVDILDGIMRITVKLAVTRPAEFIIITFEQQMQKS